MRPPRLALLLLLVLVAAPVHGRPPAKRVAAAREREREQAVQRVATAEQALAARDYRRASELLEAAYAKSPHPETLLLMALAAHGQGRLVEAQDLARRGLADPTLDAASALRARAQPLLATPRQPSGEVYVQGPGGALLGVDGRPAGVLPLALPLLLPAGSHSLVLEAEGGRPLRGQVSLRNGHVAEMRFKRETGAVLVTLPPGVILLAELRGLPVDAPPQLQRAVEPAVRRVQLGLLNTEVALAEAPEVRACAREPACQQKLAQKNDSDYVLALDVAVSGEGPRGEARLQLALFDATVGEVAARGERRCAGCGLPQILSALGELLAQVLAEGSGRARGTLSVTSTPPGATVLLLPKGQALGQTPLSRPVWSGAQELELRLPGHPPRREKVTVPDGGTGQVVVTLSQQPGAAAGAAAGVTAPASESPPRRPRWRLVLGGITLGSGALLSGLGASALAVHDRCVDEAAPPILYCGRRYDTLLPGAALLGPGLALIVTDVVLLALPPKR